MQALALNTNGKHSPTPALAPAFLRIVTPEPAGLQVAADFALPLSTVTETLGIVARKGSGKSYTAAVLAEELIAAGQQVIALDPTGAWWGLRVAADGEGPGCSVLLFGGDRGDLPLPAGSGRAVAESLVASRLSAVLDLSHLDGDAQAEFVADFAEALYHVNRAPLHLVVDEADLFAPQCRRKACGRSLLALDGLVRRGRVRGIGVTLITQRPQVISKDLLSQVGTLVALRLVAPQDRHALDGWVTAHDTAGRRAEFLGSLASLPVGEAWVWAPALGEFRRVKVRTRRTLDSSSTPTGSSAAAVASPVDCSTLAAGLGADPGAVGELLALAAAGSLPLPSESRPYLEDFTPIAGARPRRGELAGRLTSALRSRGFALVDVVPDPVKRELAEELGTTFATVRDALKRARKARGVTVDYPGWNRREPAAAPQRQPSGLTASQGRKALTVALHLVDEEPQAWEAILARALEFARQAGGR